MCDCRRSNEHFIPPPATKLFSSGGLSKIDTSGVDEMFFGGFDVKHAFYQHALPHWLQPYFGMAPLTAAELSLSSLEGAVVLCTDLIYPVMNVIPMGWTWALHFVQGIHEGIMTDSLGDMEGYLARDFAPPPRPEDGPIVSLYVDNIIIQGSARGRVDELLDIVSAGFEKQGLHLHPTDRACQEYQCLGVMLKGRPTGIGLIEGRYWRPWCPVHDAEVRLGTQP